MSLINQLNATTGYFWLQTKPEDIVNKASALAWKLMGNAIERDNWLVKPHETVDGGLMVKVPLEYASSNRGAYGATTVIEQSKKDIVDAARFRWGGVYGSNSQDLDDITQNSGDEAIVDLTLTYVESIIKSARVQLSEDLIAAATDSNHINGLGDLFNTTTSTEYGAIAEDDMAEWKANVITTSEAISFAVMQKIFRQVGMGSYAGMLPNIVVGTTALTDGYERSLQTQQRYMQDKKMVEAGFENVLHKGAPVVADPYYDDNLSGVMDALNLNYLELRAHRDFNFTTPVWESKRVLGQPDNMTAETRWRGNLFCKSRRMHVRHTNLSEPS